MSLSGALLVLGLAAVALMAIVGTASAADPPRRAPGLLEIDSIRVGSSKAPVVVRLEAPRAAKIRAWVDGRPARAHFHRVGARLRDAHLTSHNGLQDGANRIRFRARLPGGRFDQVGRTVRLGEGNPIADAGRDESAIVGETVSVGRDDTSPGLPKPQGPQWRIVSAPAGSQAELVDPRSETPELTPDVNGTYVLGLVVRGPGETTRDTVILTARFDDPPIGVPIETLSAEPDGAIRIAGAPVKDTTDRNGIFVAVLERTTRSVVESGTVPRNRAGIDQLRLIAGKWGGDAQTDDYIMIVSGTSGINAGDDVNAFAKLVEFLGGEKLSQAARSGLANGAPFSIFGIPGGVEGAAWTRFGSGPDEPSVGSIKGFLQLNQAYVTPLGEKNYDLVSPDHLHFETRADGAQPTSNTVVVGEQRVSASLPDGATAGFHLVLVNAQTGDVLHNLAAATNGGIYDNATGQADVGTALKNWAHDFPLGVVLIVQSIGHPKGSTVGWNAAAEGIDLYGGSKFVFNGLDGGDDYALVGQPDAIVPAVESSTLAKEDGELAGMLSRDRHYRYAPVLATDDLSPVTEEMYEIAYQDPQPFPSFDSDEAKRAETYIGIGLKFCGADSASCPVRPNYYKKYDSEDWAGDYDKLRDQIVHPGGSPGFSVETFDAVKKQLLTEILDVRTVKSYFDKLQQPFGSVEGKSLLDLKKLGDQLKQDVSAGGGRGSGWALQLVAAVLAIASEGATEEVSPYLSTSAGVFGLVSLFADDDGSPILADDIDANVNDLAGRLQSRYEVAQRATTGIAMMIVSDWGKLQAAAAKIGPEWKLPTPLADAVPPLRLASGQWFASALVPSVYPNLLRATPPPVGPGTPQGTECFFEIGEGGYYDHPWSGLPSNMQVQVTLLHENDGRATKTSLWATRGFQYQPSAAIGNLLFNKPGGRSPGYGLHPLRFFDPSQFDGRVLSADDTTTRCNLPF